MKMMMEASSSEIVETDEQLKMENRTWNRRMVRKSGNLHSIEDDINRLFDAIEFRTSASRNMLGKRPISFGSYQAAGIGISEPASLKQALRGLSISQASETAAIKKRLLKPVGTSGASEANAIKRLVFSANGSGLNLNQGKVNRVEISLVPEMTVRNLQKSKLDFPGQDARFINATISDDTTKNLSTPDQIVGFPRKSKPNKEHMDKLPSGSSLNNSTSTSKIKKSRSKRPWILGPIFKNKSFIKRKTKQVSTNPISNELGPSTSSSYKNENKEKSKASPASSIEVNSITTDDTATSSIGFSSTSTSVNKPSKSSIGDYSTTSTTTTSNIEDSVLSMNTRPHMSKDIRWVAIHNVQRHNGSVGWKNFKLVKKLGCGDIGSVYLAELIGTNCLFAMKVMDNEYLSSRKKTIRVQTEREILQMLDHPFLPTLYAQFGTEKLSCFVMEYCPGGDLHVLRQMQPSKSFSEQAARFYITEVLLALEYLHMLGVVYRDLKPENILVREDGHIMLTDFDLSLRCTAHPIIIQSSSPEPKDKISTPCAEANCIDPLCLNPSFQVPCFTPGLHLSVSAKPSKSKNHIAAKFSLKPQLVVEPTSARSNSFVGTHEYLAPEIIKGEGHGSAVDWWMLGIFLFELLYGKTPFKGCGNDETLANIVFQSLKFPSKPIVSFRARDLIKGLLTKEPENRLGSVKGATEIKQHPFFEGLNWALIRCTTPPEFHSSGDVASLEKMSSKCKETEFKMF